MSVTSKRAIRTDTVEEVREPTFDLWAENWFVVAGA
jgi:hypothetical protein